jgi:hypothetical protein
VDARGAVDRHICDAADQEVRSSSEPIPKYGETRCYIRDPDGYIIDVGQTTDPA